METPNQGTLSLSELISALSYALDLTEGQPMGHAMRTCILGMRIASELGLSESEKSDLYYALLLKDAGCSSNSSKLFHIIASDEIRAKREVKMTDWTSVGWESLQYALRNVRTGAPLLQRIWGLAVVTATNKPRTQELVKIRCERGASVVRKIGLSDATAEAIYNLDEHWDGCGYPMGLKGADIPRFSGILNLAQTLDVFLREGDAEQAIRVAKKRSGRWFDPDLVRAAVSLHRRAALFAELDDSSVKTQVLALEPKGRELPATDEVLDRVCEAFAEVIDAKSPYTYRHSTGVAAAAVFVSNQLGLDARATNMIRRAALLHDIGKLSVPNIILEKPGKLDNAEWKVVKDHPYYTLEVLRRVSGFHHLADVAAAHHERLDGSGYFRDMNAENLTLPARILAVADIYDALSAKRPYRDALDPDKVFEILRKDAPRAIDADCVEALSANREPATLQLESLRRAIQAPEPSVVRV